MTDGGLAGRAAKVLFPTPLRSPALVAGRGAWVTAEDGRRFLDAVAGPCVQILGHGHPRVTQAIVQQSRRLVHSSFHLNQPTVALAEQLVGVAGAPFSRVFFATSGSHAVEVAVTLALRHAACRDRTRHVVVTLDGGHHGRSGLALALTDAGPGHAGPVGAAPVEVVRLPVPEAGDGHAAIDRALEGRAEDRIVAVVAEPMLGVGGAVALPVAFVRALRSLCSERQALLIFDEVFTGFGRTGTTFAFEATDVVPDVLVVGKALGGGLPIGAVLTTDEVAAGWEPADQSTTFGANAVLGAAAGLAVLHEVTGGNLPEAAAVSGARLLEMVRPAATEHPGVVEVRGRGLLVAVEFVRLEQAKAFKAALLRAGVLAVGGPRQTVRLTPPLNLTEPELAFLGQATCQALAAVAS